MIKKTIRFRIKTLEIECYIVIRKSEFTVQVFLERGDNPHHLFDFNLEKWSDSGRNLIWFNFLDKWIINGPTI